MFDFGLSELAIIGLVALVVIGPERLPTVARTIGTLVGRAQRYVADVKAEVSREMELDALRKVQESVREAAQTVENTIHDQMRTVASELDSVARSVSGTPDATYPADVPLPDAAATPAKRHRWRRNRVARQAGMPLWYKQASRKRTRVISAAARVARYRRH